MKLKTHLFTLATILVLLMTSVGKLWAQADVLDLPANAYKKSWIELVELKLDRL